MFLAMKFVLYGYGQIELHVLGFVDLMVPVDQFDPHSVLAGRQPRNVDRVIVTCVRPPPRKIVHSDMQLMVSAALAAALAVSASVAVHAVPADEPRTSQPLRVQDVAAPSDPANAIRPFHVHVSDAQLADLRRRLAATRWPDRETVADRSQGAQLEKVQELVQYWGTSYDCVRRKRGSTRCRNT
jgi:hypothetical protein